MFYRLRAVCFSPGLCRKKRIDFVKLIACLAFQNHKKHDEKVPKLAHLAP